MSSIRDSRCPVCGRPSAAATAPFCSPGCRDRDLLAWLGEGYRLPGRPVLGDEEGLDSQPEPPV